MRSCSALREQRSHYACGDGVASTSVFNISLATNRAAPVARVYRLCLCLCLSLSVSLPLLKCPKMQQENGARITVHLLMGASHRPGFIDIFCASTCELAAGFRGKGSAFVGFLHVTDRLSTYNTATRRFSPPRLQFAVLSLARLDHSQRCMHAHVAHRSHRAVQGNYSSMPWKAYERRIRTSIIHRSDMCRIMSASAPERRSCLRVVGPGEHHFMKYMKPQVRTYAIYATYVSTYLRLCVCLHMNYFQFWVLSHHTKIPRV